MRPRRPWPGRRSGPGSDGRPPGKRPRRHCAGNEGFVAPCQGRSWHLPRQSTVAKSRPGFPSRKEITSPGQNHLQRVLGPVGDLESRPVIGHIPDRLEVHSARGG